MRYLTSEWIEAANNAVQAAAATAPTARVVIDQHVHDAIDYRVIVERDACSITELAVAATTSDQGPADAEFRQDRRTAVAVAQGTTDAHQAFLLGQITFVGNIDVLIERRDAFTWLAAALEPVLAQTSFD